MHLIDDHVVLTPGDLAQCEFSLVREVAELKCLIPSVSEPRFMGERAGALEAEHRARVVEEYRRKYSRMFTDLGEAPAPSLTALRARHTDTLGELRSLRGVGGGTVVVDLETQVLLASSPAVVLPSTVADTVAGRFARAGDLARLGAHAHAASAATGTPTSNAYLHLNNDRRQEYSGSTLETVASARLAHLSRLLQAAATRTEAWPWGDPEVVACGFCARCRSAAETHRDIQLVWGMRREPRESLVRAGITTIEELAAAESAPESIDPYSWARFQERATLQLREERTGERTAVVHDPGALAALPDPSPGDIFFDFEGDPFWVEKNRFEWGLEFLFGYIEADTGEYIAMWSASQAEEKKSFAQFLEYLTKRRRAFPGMHVYHFAFYEPSTMRRLARRHRTGQKEVTALLDEGVFVDLYETVKAGVHSSGRSYGLKALEPLYMGEDLRTSDVTDGGAAVVAFENAVRARKKGDVEAWRKTQEDLAEYNRYDCESTRRLRDWLLEQRAALAPQPDGSAVARDLLGATALESDLLLAPLEGAPEDLSSLHLRIPSFDEPGIFYVSSANSTDALGAEHKLHELLGRWGSGSEFATGQDVLVVYSDPATGPTDSSGLIARRAEILECGMAGELQRVTIREATSPHDPATHALLPSHLDVSLPALDSTALLKAAKRFTYSVITGPPGAGKSALAADQALEHSSAVVIDDAHQVSILDALDTAGAAEHIIVAGDPARATPVHRRALPSDLVHGPLLAWLLGESGAKITARTSLTEGSRFHRELAADLKDFLYPSADFVEPPSTELRLAPEDLSGITAHAVPHRGNRGTSREEAAAVTALIRRLLSASPLAESDIIVTAAFDSQVLLLRRELAPWPELRILPLRETAGEEGAVVVLSLGVSTLADLPLGAPRMPLAPHVLGAALTRARECAVIVHSSNLLEQLPPRAPMFTDVARFADLVRSRTGPGLAD